MASGVWRWLAGGVLALGLGGAAQAAARCDSPAMAATAAKVRGIVDPLVTAQMAREGMPGAAFVFVQDDCVLVARGYGVASLATGEPVDPARTVWPIASVTKLFTATAAMQLVADGRLALDRDVNTELSGLQVPGGYPAVTLRHLLSHSGGLDELPGRQFNGRRLPELRDFLATRLVRYRAPGRRTAYSTYGIALTGLLIEQASGEDYAAYLQRRLFAPAGMASARVMTRLGDEAGVATPYRLEDGKAEPMAYEWYMTPPASSVVATAADMGRFVRLHLNDGEVDGARLLPAGLAREMRRQQATIHPALPGWGLGFQLDRANGLELAEHGGDIGGFSSLLSLVPGKHSGFFIVNHGEGDDLRFKVRAALLDGLWPAPPRRVPPANPARAAELRRAYAGRYLSSLACQTCQRDGDDDVFKVEVTPAGELSVWGTAWRPVGRDLFVSDDGRRLLGFSRGADGRVDAMSGGAWRVANRLRP